MGVVFYTSETLNIHKNNSKICAVQTNVLFVQAKEVVKCQNQDNLTQL